MRFPPLPLLQTPHLVLRALALSDAPAYYQRLGSSAAVCRHMLWQPHLDISQSIASIQKTLARYAVGGGATAGPLPAVQTAS